VRKATNKLPNQVISPTGFSCTCARTHFGKKFASQGGKHNIRRIPHLIGAHTHEETLGLINLAENCSGVQKAENKKNSEELVVPSL